MVLLFKGYGSFIWGCGSFLRDIVLLFGWYGSSILVMIFLLGGYGRFIWGVWYIYLGSRVCLVEGYGSLIWGVSESR